LADTREHRSCAAGTYVWDGSTNAAFDPPQQFAREQAIFGATTQCGDCH
jgi:hypothetical protein